MKKIILLIVILIAAAGAAWYFLYLKRPCARLVMQHCGENREACARAIEMVEENMSQDQCKAALKGEDKIKELLGEGSGRVKKALDALMGD